ncbi:MAG: cupin domain-containing protein [Gaiellales bacterium]
MTDLNIYEPEFDETPGREPREGFMARRSYLGRRASATRLGASLWHVAAGEAAYPYHFHLGEEELLVVVEGSGQLRTPAGWEPLERGAVLSFPTGEAGAHQVVNDGSETLVFLAVSTAGAPDICVYPDAGKIGAFERGPNGSGVWEFYRREDEAGYWSGVVPPAIEPR